MDNSTHSNIVRKILDVSVEPTAFIVLFFVLVNRVVIGGGWINIAQSTIEKVYMECILWILDGALFLWIASQNKNSSGYLYLWKKNWILIIFILFSTISLFWSEFFIVSLYKVFVLLACSTIAAYIGMTYPLKEIIRRLVWFFIFAIGLSYLIVILNPALGIHMGAENYGAWRGWFFQKNTLGIMMSIGSIVIIINLFIFKNRFIIRLLKFCAYLLSALLVFLSRSAAGIILFIILNFSLLFVFAWVKWNKSLKPVHLLIMGFLVIILIILSLSNMEFLLGLLNKNATLTGRVPMWSFLIHNNLSNHPLIGGGFGTPWASDQFRLATQNAVGWVPITAHNGYIDIYLHFGVIGLILLISTLFLCLYRVIRYAIIGKTLLSFFPFLVIFFLIIVNISESFFLEMESFGWFLMVYSLFATTIIKQRKLNDSKPI